MSNSSILFVCTHNAARSQMAEGFAKQIAPPGVTIASAGMTATTVNPTAITIMNELGVDIHEQTSKSLVDLNRSHFDLVITLCDQVKESGSIFPGASATIHWSLKDPTSLTGPKETIKRQYLQIALEIKDRISALFQGGYLEAFISQNRNLKDNLENILDCLSEGIIAHDLERKIFFFSRGAEKITGFNESEVLGKDCHDVFGTYLCGPNCSFCTSKDTFTNVHLKQYSTVFLNSDGVRKEFDVSVIPMLDKNNKKIGVVGSFTDRTAYKTLERQLEEEHEFRGIIGRDYKMQHLYELIRDLAQCDFPVAISGESGTGKELVAKAIHLESTRNLKHFVPINCGALPEGTLESELFGHVKGAFTGAIRDKKGRFELADGGTLFLDEVAELSQAIQVKLLRVLQEGIIEPVGSERSKQVDVRIISATNKNLKELVKKGSFREDLYYRLAVVPIELSPLRDRRNDIPLLVQHFLDSITAKLGRPKLQLSKEAMSVLMSYAWPGNIRQLQNAIQFTMIKCHGETILPEHLPPEIYGGISVLEIYNQNKTGKVGRRPKLAEESVKESLIKSGGNKAKAARMLGVGRATLYNFLKDHPDLLQLLGSE